MYQVNKDEFQKVGDSRSFQIEVEGRLMPAFAILTEQGVRAYLNVCPHARVPLDYDDNDFYHPRFERIVCKTHGATFEPASGECDSGPCFGQILTSLKIEDEGSHFKLYYAREIL